MIFNNFFCNTQPETGAGSFFSRPIHAIEAVKYLFTFLFWNAASIVNNLHSDSRGSFLGAKKNLAPRR